MIFVKIQKILIKKSKKNILIKYNGRIIYNSKLKVNLLILLMGNMIFRCKCCDRNKWNKDEEKNEIRKEKNENNYLTANDLRIIIKNGFSKKNYDEKSNGLNNDSLNFDFQNKNKNENLIPKDEYSKYMFANINDIRQNPKNFNKKIQKEYINKK